MVDLNNPKIVRVPAAFASELDAVQKFQGRELTDDLKRKIKLFYGYLIQRQIFLRKFRWIHLNSEFLRKKIHQRDYRVGIDYLVLNGYIERNKSYLVESYSKSFRINQSKFDPKAEVIELWEFPVSFPDLSLCPSLAVMSFSASDLEVMKQEGFKLKDEKKKGWKKLCWDSALGRVEDRDWILTIDGKTGRIFTNATVMSKKMRPRILLEGESTVEIDIKCSQPFFALKLYPSQNEEWKRYRDLVASGRFYEAIGAYIPEADWPDRERLKKKIFGHVFYGQVNDQKPLWKGFISLFPELGSIIRTKRLPKKPRARKSNELALELQKTEADVVVGGLLAECILEKIPLLTVHDSVICKKSDQQRVLEKFQSHLLKSVGVLPTLRISP